MKHKVGDLYRLKPKSQRSAVFVPRCEFIIILSDEGADGLHENGLLLYTFGATDRNPVGQNNPEYLNTEWLEVLYERVA